MEKPVRPDERDDRVLPATRWVSLLFGLILVSAVAILWGTPDKTAERWAWTIKPELTPIFMGSVYAAGAYFFGRVFFARRWHPAAAAFVGGTVLTLLILITTLIHWERFNHGDAPTPGAITFYGWVGIYIFAPAILALLWLRNRRTDPGRPDPQDAVVGDGLLRTARIIAGAAILGAFFLLLVPDAAIDIWPWKLTALTARVLGSYTATIAAVLIAVSLDARWSAWRLVVQTLLVFTAFLMVGALRAWGDFDEDNVLTWFYLAGMLVAFLALILLYWSMERQSRGPTPATPQRAG